MALPPTSVKMLPIYRRKQKASNIVDKFFDTCREAIESWNECPIRTPSFKSRKAKNFLKDVARKQVKLTYRDAKDEIKMKYED